MVVHHVGFSTGETFRNSVVGPIIGRLDVGVAIFFVLSGYLLFRPFVAGLATGRMPGTWRSYFVKRFARIYPPLVPALIATAAAKNLLDMSPVEWVAHATLLHTFVPDWVFDVMSQAWTLTAELGFYLLLPAFVAALAVRCERQPTRERLKTAGRWSFGLVILSWLFNAAVLNSGWEHRFLGVILGEVAFGHAVGRTGRTEDEAMHARGPGRIEQGHALYQICLEVGAGVLHRPAHRQEAGEMHDRIVAAEGRGHRTQVADVAADQFGSGFGNGGPVPGREVVDHRDLVAEAKKFGDRM